MVGKRSIFSDPYRKSTKYHPKTQKFRVGIHFKTECKIKLSDHTVDV